ncbi:bifunctional DNA primase/polymerase [uncultured Ruegeria sp.]|uniref:bifunctional DNA primase/polymerase n=1 Tax=uncultured Ruegeria sp. TaxID=259304 RepID=UPI0026081A5A|nr:bifunctional DNA primase/polymerase [uncultured Ruegeria sp.]
MLANPSPYHRAAANLRENGYRAMPVSPGTKIPGQFSAGDWRPMSGWAKYCDSLPAEFIHEQWEKWPEAGVCVAHGNIIGLDLDTDRKDVSEALHQAVEPSLIRRRGQKGWMGYYRPGDGLDDLTARVRWYDDEGVVCVELLLHGTQSVLPPTIHPGTGKPYTWLPGGETLEDTDISDLPEFSGEDLAALDREFGGVGLSRKAPRRVSDREYDRPASGGHDLEKPIGRSINDRAMEAIDTWWPLLDMPKSRQRAPGAWEAVPFWRVSNSGRAVHDRNPNLKAVPSGIVDFGADRSYTPIDLVMCARDCSDGAAMDWLRQYIRSEAGAVDIGISISGNGNQSHAQEFKVVHADSTLNGNHVKSTFQPDRWAAIPVFAGKRSYAGVKPISLPSDEEWETQIAKEPPDFPLQDFSVCEGLLGDMASHIDNASATATEAGALAVSLPLLGAVMGRAYASPTNLRTNIYSVALGGSGTGKTSLVNPAKEVMQLGQVAQMIGQDRIASGSGLLKMLTAESRRICFLDEFGHMLQQIGSPGSGVHAKQIITEFTALFSGANTLFSGTAYASQEPTPIDCPNLCLFGMATPDQFWRAFGSSSLEDGSIARYLVFPLGQTAPKEMDVSAAQDVADALKELQAAISGRVRGNLGQSQVFTVPMDEAAQVARNALKDKETAFAEYAEMNAVRGGSAILRRVTENAIKIALISAVGRNVDNPEIDGRDMDIGHALAWWSANVMISNIASHIADNQYERDVNEVERYIIEGKTDGRSMEMIGNRFRGIKRRDRMEILEALEESGQISVETNTNPFGGRPRKIFRGAL